MTTGPATSALLRPGCSIQALPPMGCGHSTVQHDDNDSAYDQFGVTQSGLFQRQTSGRLHRGFGSLKVQDAGTAENVAVPPGTKPSRVQQLQGSDKNLARQQSAPVDIGSGRSSVSRSSGGRSSEDDAMTALRAPLLGASGEGAVRQRGRCEGVSVRSSAKRGRCEGVSVRSSAKRGRCEGVSVRSSAKRGG